MREMYQAYAAATQTVASTRQIVMLYDGAIRNLQQAKDAIQARQIEERFKRLVKASEIIFGLQGSLNFEEGGEVATLLYNYYSSLDSRIFALHHSNDAAACEEVIEDLRNMRSVWDTIDREQADASESESENTGGESAQSGNAGYTASAGNDSVTLSA